MTYSVIVPIYNAERYLPACLDSVLAQDSRSEYEVIMVVDGGTTDRSGDICGEYAAARPNFRALHTEHLWPGPARNHGLRAARGRYILFLDSDDLWAPDFLSTLDGFVERGPDVVTFSACQFLNQPGDKKEVHQRFLPSGETGGAWLDKLFQAHALPRPYPWIYAYRRAFLEEHGTLFRTDLWGAEDYDFNMRCLPQAEYMLGTDRVLYHYRAWEGSATHTRSLPPKRYMDELEVDEWVFRKYPNAATANRYCSGVVELSVLGGREKEREAIAFIKKNWDIWRHASYRSYHLARFLFRVLGFHNGSAVYLALEDFWHKHGKTGALAGRR